MTCRFHVSARLRFINRRYCSIIKARHQQLQDFIIAVKETAQFQTEFDKGLWCSLVDFLTVKSKDEISVTFRDGTEITVE